MNKIKQKGFVLIVSLIFLLIMTMLALSMFSGITMDETMSGNFREKARSRDAAQTALNSAENWLSNSSNVYTGNWITSSTGCTGTLASPCIGVGITSPTNLTNPASWTTFYNYTPSGMSVNAAGGAGTYAGNTQYYIEYLGASPTVQNAALYQVTAAAVGGNTTATTVLQAVYQVTSASRSIDN